jgi:hypothetical protein
MSIRGISWLAQLMEHRHAGSKIDLRPLHHSGISRTSSSATRSQRTPRNSRFVHYWEAIIMKNVEMSIDGVTLTIKVDLSREFGPSASGKTIIIASTEGNVTIPNREEKVGLNVYRKK